MVPTKYSRFTNNCHILFQDEDPFHQSIDTDVHMGTVMVVMQPVAHKVDLREQLTITNYKGSEVGLMNVIITTRLLKWNS